MENAIIKTLNFTQLHEQQLCRLFNLKEDLTKGLLTDCEAKAKQIIITEAEQQTIDSIFYKTERYGRGWNKAENMLKCIAPLIELVDFDNVKLGVESVYNRTLKTKYQSLIFQRKIDAMIVSTIPHFVLNIFENDEALDNEPTGELLAALLAIQQQGKNPVYGVYIIRQMWLFVILNNQKYSISKAFITDRKRKLEGIFKMLKAQKEMIFEYSEYASA